jgi:hypothetical protein
MSLRKNVLIEIKDKVIGKSELASLAKIIWSEYEKCDDRVIAKTFSAHVKTFGNVSYSDDEITILSDDSPIFKERIKSVEIKTVCLNALDISLRIQHAGDSDIEIGANDISRMHDIQARFQQELNAIPKQDSFYLRNYNLIQWMFWFSCTIGVGFIIDAFNKDVKFYTPFWRGAFVTVTEFIGSFLGAGVIGFFLWLAYSHYATKAMLLWPSVELQMGPEHLRPEVAGRRKINYALKWIVAPLLAALVYDIIKSVGFVLYLQK